MRRLLPVLALAALGLGACGTPAGPAPSDVLLVSVEAKGGECPEGACATRYDVYRDGRVVRSDGAEDRTDADTARRLGELVDGADWDAILGRPFTGECPTAYDGQELTYTFQAERGAVLVASCAVQIDPGQEPFATLGRVLFGS